MQNVYEILVKLTSSQPPTEHRNRILNDFAYEFGWHPSDSLNVASLDEVANAHLVVEYGLENTAVLTFLRNPRRFSDLDFLERKTLLGISYNNLVDWHLYIQTDEIVFVFNLTDPPKIVERFSISRDKLEVLRSEVFEQVTGKRPSPNVPALDNALIETIAFWKRGLSAEMGYSVSNEELSTLFNAIIFVRAAEDHFRRFGLQSAQPTTTLLEDWVSESSSNFSLRQAIMLNLGRGFSELPSYLIDEALLGRFDSLDKDTVSALLKDFYRNKYAPYEYDFSLISKHALSRIYEHYVSLLRLEEDKSSQATLFPRLPEAEKNKSYGSVYTPQFIARFFARYLREQMPPIQFRSLQTMDPACGSGIFLRSLLEVQCDPTHNGLSTDQIRSAFQNVWGMDVDKNACHATKLSLALLYMVLTDNLPEDLRVLPAEAIEYYLTHEEEIREKYDAVFVNPPFIALTTQSVGMRARVSEFMQNYASGRIDAYLAFLRIGLELLKPGGYAFFVLPHSFLLSKTAARMRRLISDSSWIRCLADLSAIRVFGDTGSYVILLAFQKKPHNVQSSPSATVVECQDLVGRALQDAVEGRRISTPLYKVYDVGQETFKSDTWLLLPPRELALKTKLSAFPAIDRFMVIRQGFISGADDVFIVPASEIPGDEREIFVPFLSDREMKPYAVPTRTLQYFFYPYLDGEKLDEKTLKSQFPETWKYLLSHKKRLLKRGSLQKYKRAWWEPMWSRPPENMMRPKIVSPHLTLLPRFSLDRVGKYAISHSPLLYPKEEAFESRVINESGLLRFFLAVLNSSPCHWFISQHSHVYRGGYLMLEPKTLASTPVPDPTEVPAVQFRRIVDLVEKRLKSSGANQGEIENEIDDLIAELFRLSSDERRLVGIMEHQIADKAPNI